MSPRSDIPSFEEAKPSLVGSYVVSGTDPDGRPYASNGVVDISLAASGALELGTTASRLASANVLLRLADHHLDLVYETPGRAAQFCRSSAPSVAASP